jgi:hypothetical protein
MCGGLLVNTIGLLLFLEIAVASEAIAEQPSTWGPARLGKENTLEFLTIGPEEASTGRRSGLLKSEARCTCVSVGGLPRGSPKLPARAVERCDYTA